MMHDLQLELPLVHERGTRRSSKLPWRFDGRPDNATKQSGSTPTLIWPHQAAEGVGMSKDQQVTAVRVGNVPRQQFADAVEASASEYLLSPIALARCRQSLAHLYRMVD